MFSGNMSIKSIARSKYLITIKTRNANVGYVMTFYVPCHISFSVGLIITICTLKRHLV